ncbi:DUF4357 domain-containing protein [Kitasatospora sp. NPDC092039]|uniref:DUF4357 domain-containing protein n=1 Tax=Kitasatospora sp. NPDC092039 TaxID=3364086 RepID=UPI003815D032
MSEHYPAFQLRLPKGGPVAHGRLLADGASGIQKFVIRAGSPARSEVVPSFALGTNTYHRIRQQLIEDGTIQPSEQWPGWLEVSEDVECTSPSAAGSILTGSSVNGWEVWRTAGGRPLSDFMGQDLGTGSPAAALREAELPEPGQDLADELHVHDRAWLQEIRDLLCDEQQLVLYGPPGTGKTHLALKLAEFLSGGPERVKLVQFHPSYTYEDFFEGFRPQEDPDSREVAFRLTPGPLRELADLASREGNQHVPHFLVIDEMNRANLAKVFGELYFLLEYRDRSVRLTYSGDDFALPPNLFVIGTMNTADRSIALVDAAMRRRFAFVELSPRVEPTRGLLRRWLRAVGKDDEPADLLDALNARVDDSEFMFGPSYLMKKGVHREGGLERTWRTKILPLLEEHHYGEGVDVEARYGLETLRAAIRHRRGASTA